jgi:hypothetical protein
MLQPFEGFELFKIQWIHLVRGQPVSRCPNVGEPLYDLDAAGRSMQTQIVPQIKQLHPIRLQEQVHKAHTPLPLGCAGRILAVTNPFGIADTIHPIGRVI